MASPARSAQQFEHARIARRDDRADQRGAADPAGLAGPVVNVGTMGGYLQYKYGTFFPLLLSLWTILALSGHAGRRSTAREASNSWPRPACRGRGSPSRSSPATLPDWSFVFLVTLVSIAIAGSTFGILPGDEFSVTSAFGYSVWMILMALAAGSVAFALASVHRPWRGRRHRRLHHVRRVPPHRLSGSLSRSSRRSPTSPGSAGPTTTCRWPASFDWPSVVLLGGLRGRSCWSSASWLSFDATSASRARFRCRRFPRALVGLRGPFSRSIGQNLGAALAWGLGIGVFGLLLGGAAHGLHGPAPELAAIH